MSANPPSSHASNSQAALSLLFTMAQAEVSTRRLRCKTARADMAKAPVAAAAVAADGAAVRSGNPVRQPARRPARVTLYSRFCRPAAKGVQLRRGWSGRYKAGVQRQGRGAAGNAGKQRQGHGSAGVKTDF